MNAGVHHSFMQASAQITLSDLARRLENVVKIGVIQEVNLIDRTLRVQLGDVVTNWLPMPGEVTQNYVRWRPLKTGTQVVVFCESGDFNNAVIGQILYTESTLVPSNSPTEDVIEFSDGALLRYDTSKSELTAALPVDAKIDVSAPQGDIKVSADQGDIKVSADNGKVDVQAVNGEINLLTASGSINATCLSGFDITGNVTVTGNILATGDVAGLSVRDVVRSMSSDRAIYNAHTHTANGAAPPTPQQ